MWAHSSSIALLICKPLLSPALLLASCASILSSLSGQQTSKICDTLLNIIYALHYIVDISPHLSRTLSCAGHLYLEVGERLGKCIIKGGMGYGGGAPYLKLRWLVKLQLSCGLMLHLQVIPFMLLVFPFFTFSLILITPLITILFSSLCIYYRPIKRPITLISYWCACHIAKIKQYLYMLSFASIMVVWPKVVMLWLYPKKWGSGKPSVPPWFNA